MAETTQRKTAKVVKAKKKGAVEKEVAEVTRPGGEGKGEAEKPLEEVEGARETPVAEIPQEVRPYLKDTVLQQLMTIPSFRVRVIHYLVRKLQ